MRLASTSKSYESSLFPCMYLMRQRPKKLAGPFVRLKNFTTTIIFKNSRLVHQKRFLKKKKKKKIYEVLKVRIKKKKKKIFKSQFVIHFLTV